MKKGRLFVGGLVALVAAAVGVPDLRLAHELAAARREGLWTQASDVRRAMPLFPETENAAPLIQAAWKADRNDGGLFVHHQAILEVANGLASKGQRDEARTALASAEPSLARWRRASERPRVDHHRPYEDGYRVLFPELGGVQLAIHRLVAAARLGLKPRENLLAAARLSGLVRQEPGIVPGYEGAALGRLALDAAVSAGLGQTVEPALGPLGDVRRVLGPELPAFLDTAEYDAYVGGLRDLGIRSDMPWSERVLHTGPLVRTLKATGIARWRTLWARLPQDGADFDGAATAVDEELPKIDGLAPSYGNVMATLLARKGDPGRGGFLREIGAFERERAKARAGG